MLVMDALSLEVKVAPKKSSIEVISSSMEGGELFMTVCRNPSKKTYRVPYRFYTLFNEVVTMQEFQLPIEHPEVQVLTLALDTHLTSLTGAITTLESANNFKRVLKASKADITQESFEIVQNFVHRSQEFLNFPEDKRIVLEYYNDRPLKNLALESITEIISTIVKAIKATFSFIVDCVKAIFFISADKRKEKALSGLEYLKENKQEIATSLRAKANGKTTFRNARAKAYGVDRGAVSGKVLIDTTHRLSASLKLLKGVPSKLEGLAKETLSEVKNFKPEGDNSSVEKKLAEIIDKMSGLLSHLPESVGAVHKHTHFKDSNGKVVAVPLVPDYQVIEVLLGTSSKSKVDFKKIRDGGIDTVDEVELSVFDTLGAVISSIEELNKGLADFVAEMIDANKNTKSLGDQITTLLEKASSGNDSSAKSDATIFKVAKGIVEGMLSHTLLFSAVFNEISKLNEDTIAMLLNK